MTANSWGSELLSQAFTRICINGLPDYTKAKQLVREAGYRVGIDQTDGFEFFHDDLKIYGYIETRKARVSCTVHDPASSLEGASKIAKEKIEYLFQQAPRAWRRNGDIRAWFAPYPGLPDQDIYFGFDDRGNSDIPGGGTLNAYFRTHSQ